MYFNIPAILIIVLCLGVLVGAINGVLITRFNVAPFIATLGVLYVARGVAQLSNNGATFPNLVGVRNWETRASRFSVQGTCLGFPSLSGS